MRRWIPCVLALLLAALPAARGDDAPPPPSPAAEQKPADQRSADQRSPEEKPADEKGEPKVTKVGPYLYRVGAVTVDAKKKTVRCSGRVNMTEGGPLELLACLPTGKTHESVFTLSLRPIELETALLLLGLKSGRNPAVTYEEGSPELKRPLGDEVLIFVEWQPKSEGEQKEPPKKVRMRAERFLLNVETEKAVEEARWVFLGSRIVEDRFGADLEGSLISTYNDPLSILELVMPTVNDDVYYAVNKAVCPPLGTPIELIIEAPPPPKRAGGEKPPGGDQMPPPMGEQKPPAAGDQKAAPHENAPKQ